MVNATLENINAEIQKYASLADGIGDTHIKISSKLDGSKIKSDILFFEDENVLMQLSFNINTKKIICVFCLTEIDGDYVETLLSKIGLPTTEESIQNYKRDPSMIEKFWNDRFIKKYNEIMKYLRKSKIKYNFQEKFAPEFNKNRNNEIVENFG